MCILIFNTAPCQAPLPPEAAEAKAEDKTGPDTRGPTKAKIYPKIKRLTDSRL